MGETTGNHSYENAASLQLVCEIGARAVPPMAFDPEDILPEVERLADIVSSTTPEIHAAMGRILEKAGTPVLVTQSGSTGVTRI